MSEAAKGDQWAVEVQVNGESVPLIKPFIHDMIGGSMEGLLAALRGVDSPDQLQIRAVRLDSNDTPSP